MQAVDFNSDMGEGFGPWTIGDGVDNELMGFISTANIATIIIGALVWVLLIFALIIGPPPVLRERGARSGTDRCRARGRGASHPRHSTALGRHLGDARRL